MRIRSSSLVETVAAMAILGFVLASAGLIFSNVLQSDHAYKRTRAWAMIEGEVVRMRDQARCDAVPCNERGLDLRFDRQSLDAHRRVVHFEVRDEQGALVLEQDRLITAQWRD
jgi:hypothetical protein